VTEEDAEVSPADRPDYPNQINNVLCFPGLFRGVLDCKAKKINQDMLRSAAHAIAGVVAPDELREDYIIPSVFNRKVPEVVAEAVRKSAIATGVARLEHRYLSFYKV
jgi:malate dehydrogenase (oxaloacetate-decarboxylating)